jgi:hypothetical protein
MSVAAGFPELGRERAVERGFARGAALMVRVMRSREIAVDQLQEVVEE